jgi:hypothetical protein
MPSEAKALLQARSPEADFPKAVFHVTIHRPGRYRARTNVSSAQVATFAKSCRHHSNPIPTRCIAALKVAVGKASSEVAKLTDNSAGLCRPSTNVCKASSCGVMLPAPSVFCRHVRNTFYQKATG